MESGLTEIKNHPSSLVKIKQERLVKPHGGGILGRLVVTAGGITIGYLLLPTVPLASIAIAGALALSYLQDADKIEHPETAKRRELLLHSKTAKHPSIWESRKQLKMMYPMSAVNRAIDFMLDHCDWIEFSPQCKHPLKVYGEIYGFICPHSEEVMLPIDGIHYLMKLWQVDDSINVSAAVLPSVEVPAIAPAAESADWGSMALPGNAETLLNRLKAECPELLRLVKAPPIRVVGAQRTGKSTFVRKLLLLRCIFLDDHKAVWCTPHAERDNPVPQQLNAVGTTQSGAKDFPAIEAVWTTMQAQIDAGQQVNTSVVFDEFGGYDDGFENKDLLGVSLRSLLREASKHQYYPTLVLHGDSGAFMPGSANIVTIIKSNTVKVETIGEQANHFGEMVPTGRAQITWLDGTQSEFQTPEWLTVDYLLTLVRGNTKPDFLESPATVTPPKVEPQQPISERDRLELLFNSEPNQASEETVKPDLFDSFAATLTHESQADLKNFVLWLKKYKGQTISYDQIKGNWARHANVPRSREALMPIITVAKSNKLISPLANNSWMVAS